MMGIQGRVLGQVRPSVADTPTLLWTVAVGTEVWQATLRIVNNTASTVKVTVYYDAAGATFDDTTRILGKLDVLANETISDSDLFADSVSGGELRVECDTADAATFTASGSIITNP